jgi:predicted nuclease of restriction endonuclease-like (RecB) superfamily
MTAEARHFYAHQAADERWSVREWRQHIERKSYERTVLVSSQGPGLTQALSEALAPGAGRAAPTAAPSATYA